MVFKVRALAILASYSVFLGFPLADVWEKIKLLLDFLLLICLMSIKFLGHPEEPRQALGNPSLDRPRGTSVLHSHTSSKVLCLPVVPGSLPQATGHVLAPQPLSSARSSTAQLQDTWKGTIHVGGPILHGFLIWYAFPKFQLPPFHWIWICVLFTPWSGSTSCQLKKVYNLRVVS